MHEENITIYRNRIEYTNKIKIKKLHMYDVHILPIGN